MKIDKSSRIPLYVQLIDNIMGQISSETLKEGDQLPIESDLCDQYDISRTTVRQAMAELEKDGYIEKIHGKGVFIKVPEYKQNLTKIYSFREEMEKVGKVVTTKLISFTKEKELDLERYFEKNEVFKLVRVRLADGEPILYETTYLLAKKFPNLQKYDLENLGLYEIFKENYQMQIDKIKDSFKATTLDKEIAPLLEEQVGAPVLEIVREGYIQDQIIEYTIELARGSRFSYTIELENPQKTTVE